MTIEEQTVFLFTCDACGAKQQREKHYLPAGWTQALINRNNKGKAVSWTVEICMECSADPKRANQDAQQKFDRIPYPRYR